MELVALKPIDHSAGTIQAGAKFEASAAEAKRLIASAHAKAVDDDCHWDGIRWPSSTVVILASGASLTAEDCADVCDWRDTGWRPHQEVRAEERRVIAINTTFQRAPWADVIYACDAPWWNRYYAEARAACTGEFWTQDRKALHHETMHRVDSRPAAGLGRFPGVIHQGGNGGYQAINIAYQAGAKRIVLLGYDMGGSHWHGNHPVPLANTPAYLFDNWIAKFDQLAADLKTAGVEVINCTRDTRIMCFERRELREVIG